MGGLVSCCDLHVLARRDTYHKRIHGAAGPRIEVKLELAELLD